MIRMKIRGILLMTNLLPGYINPWSDVREFVVGRDEKKLQ